MRYDNYDRSRFRFIVWFNFQLTTNFSFSNYIRRYNKAVGRESDSKTRYFCTGGMRSATGQALRFCRRSSLRFPCRRGISVRRGIFFHLCETRMQFSNESNPWSSYLRPKFVQITHIVNLSLIAPQLMKVLNITPFQLYRYDR